MSSRNQQFMSPNEFLRIADEYKRRVGERYIQELKEDRIDLLDTLRKRARKFSRAHFYCDVCNYHIHKGEDKDFGEDMEAHRQTNAHKRKKKMKLDKDTINALPHMTTKHLEDLSSYLDKEYNRSRLKDDDLDARKRVVTELPERLHEHSTALDSVTLELSGSVKGGFPIADSDTNIRICAERNSNFALIFAEILRVMSQPDAKYQDVTEDFTSVSPSIKFRVEDVSGWFSLRVMPDEGPHRTQSLLSPYSKNSATVRKLAILLKVWAKSRKLSDAANGGLLPLCFPLLTIYFCQQHGLITVNGAETEHMRDIELGELWITMLKFYGIDFKKDIFSISITNTEPAKKEKDTSKRLRIEDPGDRKRNLAKVNVAYLDALEDEMIASYIYFCTTLLRRPNSTQCRGNSANTRLSRLNLNDPSFSMHDGKTDVQLPQVCQQCHETGHTEEECPEEELPEFKSPQPLTPHQQSVIDSLLTGLKEQLEINEADMKQRRELLRRLSMIIHESCPELNGEFDLQMYGSSANGFGKYNSDLDVCMTMRNRQSLEREDAVGIITQIGKTLVQDHSDDFPNVITITDATVPIVKFYSERYDLEGDLSLYNCLAQQNTRMLCCYSQIDERVRTLGYSLKEFAKKCEMADSYQKTLSSYAYILMLIYYLQRCDPPVLPVLQELYEGEEMPSSEVDGWNAWFYDFENKDQLKQMWPGLGKNKQDVSELWIGFLEFYADSFDYQTTVVSIRQREKLTKFQKLWNSGKIAVEDPFDQSHNLGGALTKKTNAHILSNFIIAAEVFSTPVEQPDYRQFFENERLRREPPHPKTPNSRQFHR